MKQHLFQKWQLHRFLFYTAGILLFLSSCKKKDADAGAGASKKTLISAVYINDTIVEKYHYAANRRLTKIDAFSNEGILNAVWNYEYDAAGVLQYVKSFQPDGVPITTHEYIKNGSGQIIESRFKNFKNNYQSHVEYLYEPSGNKRMLGYIEADTLGKKNIKASYNYNGGIYAGASYSQFLPGDVLVMYSKSEAQLSADAAQLNRYKEVVSSIPDPRPDNWLMDQVATTYKQYYYTAGEISYEHRAEFNNRQFNAKGYVTSLKLTIKKIKPAGPDIAKTIRYEYVEL